MEKMYEEINVNDIEFTDVVEVLSVIDCYDQEVLIEGYDKEGVKYSAIASASCGEIVEIDEDSIEKA